MKKATLFVFLVLLCAARLAPAAKSERPVPERVQIGVEIQTDFQSCLTSWLPLANYLSKTIPDHRFVIVPLASREDLLGSLEKQEIAFTIANAALDTVAADRYNTTALATMTKTRKGETKSLAAETGSRGAIIRRTDRSDIHGIRNIRGQRISAVMPWSLTGWLAQWDLLKKAGIDPHKDVAKVVFEGTPEQVIRSVLDGSADVGALDADLINQMAQDKRIPDDSLYVINREGQAVPLVAADNTASTNAYPRRAFSMASHTDDLLARRVAEALMARTVETVVDGAPHDIGWTFPRNHSKVRQLLRGLMGPNFAESPGFPLSVEYPTWLFPAYFTGSALALLAIAIILSHVYYRRREGSLQDRLEETRKELFEVRAEKQRVDTVLSLAGCGIDIVDDEDRIIFADTSLTERYGDWHGRKCHDVYCNSDTPCEGCRRPEANDEPSQRVQILDGSQQTTADDPHAKVHSIHGKNARMIGIPFRDEGGRWLYARLHLPLDDAQPKDASSQSPT